MFRMNSGMPVDCSINSRPCRVVSKVKLMAQGVKITDTIQDESGNILCRGRVGGGIRKGITSFSHASRLRLLEKMASEDRECTFVTLTFGVDYPSARDAKKALEKLYKKVVYRCPEATFIWRIELQKRQAPHFHVLVYGLTFDYPFVKSWIRLKEVKNSHPKLSDLKKHSCKVEKLKTQNGVKFYAAKYCGKQDDLEGDIGRRWGVMGERKSTTKVEEVYARDLYQQMLEKGIITEDFNGGLLFLTPEKLSDIRVMIANCKEWQKEKKAKKGVKYENSVDLFKNFEKNLKSR